MASKASEFRKRPSEELQAELREKQRECFNIRFQQASEKATNPELLKSLRKDVARIKTILRERELAGKESS
jgi:large subunit ribosomal protein L29